MRKAFFLEYILFSCLVILIFSFAFVVPPLQKPDEEVHFYRVLNLAEGNLFCSKPTGNNLRLNTSTQYLIRRMHGLELPLHEENKFDYFLYAETLAIKDLPTGFKNYSVDYQCNYPIVSYLPHTIGILIASLFSSNGLVLFFAGRFAMSLIALLWMYMLYRKINPSMRPLLTTLLFIPVLLQQVTAFSYDGIHILLALTCFVLLVNRSKKLVLLFIATLLLLLAKPSGYELFALLFFALPTATVAETKKQYILRALLFLSGLALLYGFSKIGLFTSYGSGERLRTDVSPSENLSLFLQNPLYLVRDIISTTFRRGIFYIQSTIGILGWLEYSIGATGYAAYGALTGYVLILTENRFIRTFSRRWIGVAVLVTTGTYVILLATFAVLWTPPHSSFIDGVQGRYFLVLVPFWYFIVAYIRQKLFPKVLLVHNALILGLLLCLVTATAVAAIFVRYY